MLLPILGLLALASPVTTSVITSAAPPHIEGPSTLLVGGFTDTLVTSATPTPVSVVALPHGRVAVLEQGGRIRLIDNGVLLPGNALDLTTTPNRMTGCTTLERGLLGFAVDPDFGANGFVYVYYTRAKIGAGFGDCVNRVSRFVMTGNTISRASEVILLDNISAVSGNRNGGDIEVGNDGLLYVAVGDAGCDPRGDSGCGGSNNGAQDLSLLNGKILRINRLNGAPAPGNPFMSGGVACRIRGNTPSTPTSTCQEIFAYGLRNPRLAFDPNTGATRFNINDTGEGAREEVNLGILGANYGWPVREGFCANAEDATSVNPGCAAPIPSLGFTQPIIDYPHQPATGGNYITGGAFIPNGSWPKVYDGGYVFSDKNPGKVFIKPGASPFSTLATGLSGVSDIEFVPEASGWSLYYANPTTNEVRRISYTLAAAPSVGTLAFAPTSPTRVFDSRNNGSNTGTLRGGTSRMINVVTPQGTHRAALVNITAVQPAWDGYVTVWRPRTLPPPTSNLNSQFGKVNANTSVVPIDDDGNIIVFASARTHLIVDVLGFFDVAGGGVATAGRLMPVDPVRAIDTRAEPSGSNLYTESVENSTPVINVPLAGLFGLPPGGATVVCVMVTAIAPAGPAAGFVVVHGHGTSVPATSNLNTNGAGDTRPNLVVVALGADGSIDLRLTAVADVIVDVIGSFTDGTAPSISYGTYQLVGPSRIIDTRSGFGLPHFSAGSTGTIDPSVVPTGAVAISQNVVITNTADFGYITTYPAGLPQPVVSNGNASGPNQTRSVLSFTRMGVTSVSYYTSMATDVVVDITGYFNA